MCAIVAKALGLLRVAYIAFALLLGVGFTGASALYLWDGIKTAVEVDDCKATAQPDPGTIVNCYGIDGPDPLSFESYGKGPISLDFSPSRTNCWSRATPRHGARVA